MTDAPDERPEVLINRKQYYEDFKVRLRIHNREFTEFVVEVGNFVNWTKPHVKSFVDDIKNRIEGTKTEVAQGSQNSADDRVE
tara:strand:- start:456 stop:704 length:249 start_codon:yes stop_codon:yes gene_type:complete